MGQRGGAGEEDHAPVRRAGEQARLRHARIDGGDEDALTQEIGHEPADDQDQQRREERRHEREQEHGGALRAEGVDPEAGEDDEDRPEADQAKDVRRQAQHPSTAQTTSDAPPFHGAVEPDGAGDAAHQGSRHGGHHEPHGDEGQHEEDRGKNRNQPVADLRQRRSEVLTRASVHGRGSRVDHTPGRMPVKCDFTDCLP